MDYQKELKKLEEQEASISSEFWKPEAGQYRVKALGEIVDAEPYEEQGKEPQPRKMIQLLIDNKTVTWTMPEGKTPASSYGQLVRLASIRNNKLTNVEFTIVVVGSEKNKRFTVVG